MQKLIKICAYLIIFFVWPESALKAPFQRRNNKTFMMEVATKIEVIEARIAAMKERASACIQFSEAELDMVIKSLQNVGGESSNIDWSALRELFAETAHLSYKNWPQTESYAHRLLTLLSGPDDPGFCEMFHRVLGDGGWQTAAKLTNEKPWVVLVCGLNGIRKTTSMYQPWFKDALHAALSQKYPEIVKEELPSGENAFFRQLDYMIATIANEEFRSLYEVDDIRLYASLKDAIFARFRTIAEVLGVLLIKEAQTKKMNVMVETSGRDIGMYHYVNHLFPEESGYRKLVIHFEINDVAFAEKSVDARMATEMLTGSEAIRRGASAREVILANAGGPYGSQVLRQVEADSQIVWEKVLAGTSGLDDAESWHKASITINGHEVDPWTVTVGRKRKLESDDSIVSVVGEGKSEDVPTVFSFPCKR